MNVILLSFFTTLLVYTADGALLSCDAPYNWPADLVAAKFSSYAFADVDPGSNTGDELIGDGYLMGAAEYFVPDTCQCGVLYKWKILARGSGMIQFMVWEHYNISSDYILKGENFFFVPGDSTNGRYLEFTVPESERITIRSNYLIGWFSSSNSMHDGIIAFHKDDGMDSLTDEAMVDKTMTKLSAANEPLYPWIFDEDVAKDNTNKIYAIGAEAMANTPPAFTNLPRTVIIYDDEVAGALIYEISASDIDSYDIPYLDIYETTDNETSDFYYDAASRTIYLAVDNPSVGILNMTFQVQDQCTNAVTETLTIEVKNWAPSLENLPGFASIDEDFEDTKVLYNIEWTDKDDAYLNLTYTNKPDKMTFRADGRAPCYEECGPNVTILVETGGVNLAYSDAPQYIVNVSFVDSEMQTTDSGYFMLYVNKNNPPKFTNLNNGAKAYASYLTTAKGDVIYVVSATDAENDRLVFNMSCDPSPCPLEMTNTNGAVGVISATENFRGRRDTGWDIGVSVKDEPLGTNTPGTLVGPQYLSVIVQDINFIPKFVNLPLDHDIPVHEGTPLGTTLFTVAFLDADTNDNHTFLVYYDNTWAVNYFELSNTTGVLSTAYNVLDFEDLPEPMVYSVTLNITITDGVDTASETLTIAIRNVNEAPSFHQTKYTLEVPEEGQTGVSIGGKWEDELTDPDDSDIHTFNWDCGEYTRYFRMKLSDGSVTYATQFDYDEVNFTAPFDCVVTATDESGLTATTTIEIDIHDENDNAPVFTLLSDDYYFFQTPYLDPGRFVGQVTATDADRDSENKDIYYSWHTYPANLEKSFVVINNYGNIYVNETWTKPLFDFDTSYTFVVMAENVKEGLSPYDRMTATATVILYLSGTTTTQAITTDRPLEFIQDTRNVVWLAIAISAGTLLLVIVCGFAMMYTIQVKRYRWCIPWCRKRLLGLKKMTRREKRRYYHGLLMQEELEELGSDSDDGQPISTLNFGNRDPSFYVDQNAPPMMWERLKNKGGAAAQGTNGPKGTVPRGPTVRNTKASGKKTSIPQAAVYDEPKPPQKNDVSKMMKTAHSKFWTKKWCAKQSSDC